MIDQSTLEVEQIESHVEEDEEVSSHDGPEVTTATSDGPPNLSSAKVHGILRFFKDIKSSQQDKTSIGDSRRIPGPSPGAK